MPAYMGVQAHATARNILAEQLVNFTLRRWAELLHSTGELQSAPSVSLHMPFVSDDSSDVFDHHLKLSSGRLGPIELWAQTTCYKGHEDGQSEPNKTYEIRETLVEALGLRRALREQGALFRTVHFTVGPAEYTYGWFKPAKDASFDLSLYPAAGTRGILDAVGAALNGSRTMEEIRNRFESCLAEAGSVVGAWITTTSQQLLDWYSSGMPANSAANLQAEHWQAIRDAAIASVEPSVLASKDGGADIKGRALAILEGGDTTDSALIACVKRITSKKPFFAASLDADLDWKNWTEKHLRLPDPKPDLAAYVRHLWTLDAPVGEVVRRLLLRAHTDASILYVHDVGVSGLTEHNLYSGAHSAKQVDGVVQKIVSDCSQAGIRRAQDLFERLAAPAGRRLLKQSRAAEVRNGTNIRPTLYYLEEALRPDYLLCSFRDACLPAPVGYQSAYASQNVRAYENLKVVVRRDGARNVAAIKAKFFSHDEFPRRCKEEAYVGLTAQSSLTAAGFEPRYPGLPFLMFVDMPADLQPPRYAVCRLVTSGWIPVFSVGRLKTYLDAH
jgi:hypothetical protein